MQEILTANGLFRGVLKDSIQVYRGITYARYDRFEEAVMVKPEGEADATYYGSVCPQRSNRLAAVMGEDRGSVVEEGRLCLSVYAPQGAEHLPVMVWIHGGAFLTGGSEEQRYSGARLVHEGNVIVVKISYRLGAFGYLYLPEQGIENLGLKDQRLALEWVRMHIAEFGGDPDDVTVFGQSAGALSIAALIATEKVALPFRRAIIQSAPLGISITPKEASRIAKAFLKKLGKDLRSAGMDDILDTQEAVKGMKTGLTFMPVVDDFQKLPSGNSDLQVVVGYTAQDASPFLRALGPLFGTALGRAVIAWATKSTFARPSEEYLRKLSAAGFGAQRYFISWCPEGNPLGSCHCIELPFILGEYEDWCESSMLRGMTREEYDRNSRELLKAWTAFANGRPFPYGEVLLAGAVDKKV